MISSIVSDNDIQLAAETFLKAIFAAKSWAI